MKLSLPICSLLYLLLISCSSDSELQSPDEPNSDDITAEELSLIESLNSEALSISAKPLLMPESELQFLDNVADARIIGLGESTHGTKEFFHMKTRIFQYLVENHGFKAFLFEMDFSEALLFNDWIQYRIDGDIGELMKNNMYFWTWRTSEVWSLLEWMRSYNKGKDDEDMIAFYGVDSQTSFYDIRYIRNLLSDLNIAINADLDNRLIQIEDIVQIYRNVPDNGVVIQMREDIFFVQEFLKELYPEIEQSLGSQQLKVITKVAEHLTEVEQVNYGSYFENNYRKRDEYMAANTSWYFDFLSEDSKFVLWAHNAHIANDPNYVGFGSQGKYLKDLYEEDYQVIGFSLSFGTVTALNNGQIRTNLFPVEPERGSSTWIFNQHEDDNFVINTNPSSDVLKSFFGTSNPFLTIGTSFYDDNADNYRNETLNEYYDYLIHFKRTEATDLIR